MLGGEQIQKASYRMTTVPIADTRRDELAGRLFGSALGAMDLLCVYLGDRLGMYRALADTGPATSAELASATGVHERYAREWLEQQAINGILQAGGPPGSRAERPHTPPARPPEGPPDPGRPQPTAP